VDCAVGITTVQPVTDLADQLAGFFAGEGCFTRSGNKFTFVVALGATDQAMCETLRDYFGVGHVYWHRRRKPHYDDEVKFQVRKFSDLVAVVVPFMDEHLPPSYKREQYETWRAELFDYWDNSAKRVRPCSVEGCERPRKAYGVCRYHMYRLFKK
jgi:hypothetical protein